MTCTLFYLWDGDLQLLQAVDVIDCVELCAEENTQVLRFSYFSTRREKLIMSHVFRFFLRFF